MEDKIFAEFFAQHPQLAAALMVSLPAMAIFGNICKLIYKPEMEQTSPRLAGLLRTGMIVGNVLVGIGGPIYQALTGKKLPGSDDPEANDGVGGGGSGGSPSVLDQDLDSDGQP